MTDKKNQGEDKKRSPSDVSQILDLLDTPAGRSGCTVVANLLMCGLGAMVVLSPETITANPLATAGAAIGASSLTLFNILGRPRSLFDCTSHILAPAVVAIGLHMTAESLQPAPKATDTPNPSTISAAELAARTQSTACVRNRVRPSHDWHVCGH